MKCTLSPEDREICDRIVKKAGLQDDEYARHTFNVLRFLQAYEREEKATVKVLKRHCHLRKRMGWTEWPDLPEEHFDSRVHRAAPLTIIGNNHPEDNKVTLFEKSGKIDIETLLDNVRVSAFMRSRFRSMEALQRLIVEQEKLTGKQSGGLLVMDLDGLSLSSRLLTILAGPYRIMWGTLFEQYPQIINQIVIINAPKFVNILYSTCIPFIPADYRARMIICSNDDPRDTLHKFIHPDYVPHPYNNDKESYDMLLPDPETELSWDVDPDVDMETVSVPAGGLIDKVFKWDEGQRIRFHLLHQDDLQFAVYHSQTENDPTDEIEVFARSERPGLKRIDVWEWTARESGIFKLRFGNEKAWFCSVSMQYRIDIHQDGQWVRQYANSEN